MNFNGSTIADGSTAVGLNLELGRGSGLSARSSGFSIFQLQELQLQTLIYKYMEAGLPVPHHLLLPIWKSVANVFGGPNDGVPLGYNSCKYLKSSPLDGFFKFSRYMFPISLISSIFASCP
jgi:hypothetical protein